MSTPDDLGRLALNTATTKHADLATCARVAAEAGFGAIGPWRDRVQEVGVEQAAKIIADAGLAVSTLCRGGFLTARADDAIAAALDDNRRAIDEAATLGTTELVMVVGGLPSTFAMMGLPSSPGDADDKSIVDARARVQDRLADLVPHARQMGVRLALEPMHPIFGADRGVLSTLAQALEMAAPFEASEVGVVVDTYHVWWDPQCRASIEAAGQQGRISSYQVCDWTLPLAANTLNSRGHVGDGHIDFASITGWVRDAGYQGPVEVEIFNEQIWATDPARTVATLAERHREHIAPHL